MTPLEQDLTKKLAEAERRIETLKKQHDAREETYATTTVRMMKAEAHLTAIREQLRPIFESLD